ncbi:hypothetical protein ACJJTC_019184 [Scirpophaga incertulas]
MSQPKTPQTATDGVKSKMERWVEAQERGEKVEINVYGKPTDQQVRELENIRSLSRELQDNLHELENSVRIANVENQAMSPTAPMLDYSEDHEFVSANQLDNYYAEEDKIDAKEEEKRRLTKGNGIATDVQNFFSGQCVFLTGGTGFLGKVLIEKLLRSCGDVDTIYVLIRSKKGKNARARLDEMLDDFLFHKANEVNPKGVHKVIPIIGDMELPDLGISDADRNLLINKVSIIINAAATVKFDEKLSVATRINVKGTKEVLKLAKSCRNLKAVTHVSTAFSNTHVEFIEEKFYEPPMSVEALEAISTLDDEILEQILPAVLGKRPNTYCLTKAIAEEAVRNDAAGLPICILRPSIVVSTYEEPVRGWTDSMYGPTGLIIGIGTGVLRTMYLNNDIVADMIPVDLVVNGILAATWYTGKTYKENQTSEIPIYNFVSGAQNPIKWGQFIEMNRRYGIDKPTTKAVWYYGLNTTKCYYMFLFYNFFLHYLPALLIDFYCLLAGKPRKMLPLYRRVMRAAHTLFYFSTKQWRFADGGARRIAAALSPADRAVFPCRADGFSWERLCETFLLGLRVYLLKDDLLTLPEARKKWNRLYYLHQVLKTITAVIVINISFLILKTIFSFMLRRVGII